MKPIKFECDKECVLSKSRELQFTHSLKICQNFKNVNPNEHSYYSYHKKFILL